MIGGFSKLALLAALLLPIAGGAAMAQAPRADSQAAANEDPVLRAMLVEMERSKTHLKLENMQAPYYIDYRLMDVDQYNAEAAFGALRNATRTHVRMLRIVVRVGDYKQDSYYGPGEGVVDLGPLDDDVTALRHRLWLGTDRAYKAATEAFTAKQAQLKQYSMDQPVDDFAHAPALQFIGPLARLEFDPQPWLRMLEEASALYRNDPQIESLNTSLRFMATNRYFVSSEGTVVRSGDSLYQTSVGGYTQAADGMRLDHFDSDEEQNLRDLPSKEKFLAQTTELLTTLKKLREAPVTEEEYRGPVLFTGYGAVDVVYQLVAPNVLGKRPMLGQNARTTGAWANNYKTRVLPDFLSVVDDPTLTSVDGQALLGYYEVDDEGVRASRVSIIANGQLVNYLVGREPIRDFPSSNGHGRVNATGAPVPSSGNLIVQSSSGLTNDELKKKLIEMCKQRDLTYGYLVKAMGSRLAPRLLYRISTKDGHEDLVRGAMFGDLDTRSLRNNIVAVGKEPAVLNGLEPLASVASPPLLFDELELKRADASKEKLPDYPPPALAAAK